MLVRELQVDMLGQERPVHMVELELLDNFAVLDMLAAGLQQGKPGVGLYRLAELHNLGQQCMTDYQLQLVDKQLFIFKIGTFTYLFV